MRFWLLCICLPVLAQTAKDPAAWDSNHVGKELPEYVHGDECLFCHREGVGHNWKDTAHGATVRQREDAPALEALLAAEPKLKAEVTHFLGSRNRMRLLKKEGYGKFQIFSASFDLKTKQWSGLDSAVWDKDKFADRCAGCHTTAVETASRTFSAFGLDCYTCHGVASLDHSKDTSLMWLSKKKRDDLLAVESICAQCHLRGGKSKSSGLPYANTFVVGDNLFQDFAVDWMLADDPALNPGDRHVYRNVRDVVINGSDVTCLSCHRVHTDSSEKHRRVLTTPACRDCHNAEGPKKAVKTYKVSSPLCEY